MLYKTNVEYGDYTMNHVLGCSHGCLYPCYAFLMAKRFGNIVDYEDWCKPRLVSNTIELLESEIPRLKSKILSVQLCFTTDPFMVGFDEIGALSMEAIKKLNSFGIRCNILTKGLLPIELAEQSSMNEYGITLVSLSEDYRKRIEPGASPYADRIAALQVLHKRGCLTWVSIEPYPTPNLIQQDLGEILDSVSFVNRIIFGRTNYNKETSAFPTHREFYNKQADIVTQFCEKRGIKYHIKKGTKT